MKMKRKIRDKETNKSSYADPNSANVSSGFVQFDNDKVLFLRIKSQVIYIIGSNHTNRKYAWLVQRVIKYVQPDVVGVELCRTRMGYKSHLADTGGRYYKEFDFKSIPPNKRRTAIGEKLRLLYAYGAVQYEQSEHFRRTLRSYRTSGSYSLPMEKVIHTNDRTPIGTELYVPFRDVRWHSNYRLGPTYLNNYNMKYKILLLDRPIEDTYHDLSQALSDKEKDLIRMYKRNFDTFFINGRGTLMENMWKRNDAFRKIFMELRDEHMATMMYQAIARHRFDKLVCIVGDAHMNGIIRYLTKKLVDFAKNNY